MYRIGIDLGGTNIAVGLVNEFCRIVVKRSTPTRASRPSDEITADMAHLCLEVCAEAKVSVMTECIKELDVTKDQVVFVGDTQRDYFCAQNAGCRFIGMGATERKRNRLQQKCEGVTIVTDYRELYQILDGT